MPRLRPIHPEFLQLLGFKSAELIKLFKDLRAHILEISPQSNELLYQTYALTTVFSVSEKVADAFCTVPIYTNHLHLGFNKGTMLDDPHTLLTGTGKHYRHLHITGPEDYKNAAVRQLIIAARDLSLADLDGPASHRGTIISKLGKKK